MEGIININKPSGITSFDVVRQLRKILHIKKIGHTGTLDPLATGVLVVCLGRATRLVQDIESYTKTYVATFDLGYKTDTYDTEGKILDEVNLEEKNITKEDLEKVISGFVGKTMQVPPMYSALKVDGKKLYELARAGITVERKKREINIDYIEILDFDGKSVKIRTKVSKGTYIRSLIYDIGEELGTFATMTALLREEVGDINIEKSIDLDKVATLAGEEDFTFITSVEEFFNYPKITISHPKELKLFKNGNTVKLTDREFADGRYRIYHESEFIGLAEVANGVLLKGYKYF